MTRKIIGRVLVFGSDTKSFLSVIRSLGRKQIEIHIAWVNSNCAARCSRYITKEHQIPKYQYNENQWKNVLKNILREEKYDLVIPCDDPSIIPLQINRSEFEKLAHFYLINNRAFRISYDKYASIELARSLGIPVPHGMIINSKEELERLLYTFKFPVVIKPLSSFIVDNLQDRRIIKKVFDIEDLRHLSLDIFEREPILVQKNFIGKGVGVGVIADRGEILTAFQHERVHQPLHGGGSSYRKSVRLHPELYEATKKLMKELDYTGVAMVEFITNPRTGAWVFLEINARFWGSLPLALAAGIDFPWYLYQLLVSGVRDFEKDYRRDLYCRNLVEDLEWFRSNLRAHHSHPVLHTLPLRKVAGELWNIILLRERSDTFVMDDPLPGFIDLSFWIKQKYQTVRRRFGLKVKCIKIIRLLTRQRVARAICNKKVILFVCTGNICRSPFAEKYAREIFRGAISAFSSGISPVEGRKPPDSAMKVAKEYGINLDDHRATSLSLRLLEDAGIIFVFDELVYETLARDYPFVRPKLCYLGIFLDNGSITIKDPIGQDSEMFRRIYREIIKAILQLKDCVDKDGAIWEAQRRSIE